MGVMVFLPPRRAPAKKTAARTGTRRDKGARPASLWPSCSRCNTCMPP